MRKNNYENDIINKANEMKRHFAAQAKLNNVEMLQQVLVKMQYCNASATQVASAKIIFNNNNKRCSKAHKRFFTCKKSGNFAAN